MSQRGYLLDNNAISRWFTQQPTVVANVQRVQAANGLIFVSVITLGEFVFGHQLRNSTDLARQEEFERWVRYTFPKSSILDVTKHVCEHYGDIKAEIFRQYPPKGRRNNHPERCVDRVTGADLGIDENDLWIAAQAITNNCVLVSNDRMKKIRTAAGHPLEVEDWEKDPSMYA